ncbi:MAG: DUF177 domain-containing protein [Candidatus Omnitrophota bacterium]
MKIDVRQIPPEGVILREEIPFGALDLEVDIIQFRSPVRVTAVARRITNAVNVEINAEVLVSCICSRCLAVFERDFKNNFSLNYQADNNAPLIELNPEIREEIMLDYPIKPLCSSDCKGLCPKCGKNLNQGGCPCATT